MIRFRSFISAVAIATAVFAALPASAQSAADFFSGRTIRFIIGTNPGGGYDLYMRTLVSHIADKIPGKPKAVVVNMPGAGGIKATNYVYSAAPRDGTTVIMPFWTHPVFQIIRPKGIKFDVRKMRWIGGMATLNSAIVAFSKDARTIDDAKKKQIILAASGKGSETYIFPKLLNSLIGTKFKIVLGYRGTRNMTLAMERGEAQGRGGAWQSWSAIQPKWHPEGRIRVLAQAGLVRIPEISYAPLIVDLVKEEDKPLARLLSVPVTMARILGTPPEVPMDRVMAFRRAFDATMKDPAFLADAKKRKMDLAPMTGEQLTKNIAAIFETPKPIIEKARRVLGY
jgi:tripartite-type tricarboxylate transporter receptor subunit TctC